MVTLSITDAAARGVAALVRQAAEQGDVMLSRHGRPVAAVVSMTRLAALEELEADLRSACLVLARAASDSGARTDLDDAIRHLGFDRGELEAELDRELSAQPPRVAHE